MNKSNYLSRFIEKTKAFPNDMRVMFSFSVNDLKKRYSGSVGGIIWAYITPLVSILVFWYVFQVGFKNSPVDDFEFILWLVPAYVAWVYANDSIAQSTNVLYEYSFLVKKVKFKISILPPMKVMVSLIIHFFFILFTYVLYFLYGHPFEVMWLQVFYYVFASSVFLVGLSYFVSAFSVFYKDFAQLVNIFLQIAFWLCPTFWNPSGMSTTVVSVLKLNPLYYIVQGYRECFVGGIPFYTHVGESIYFWVFALVLLVGGKFLFNRLSKHYADLL